MDRKDNAGLSVRPMWWPSRNGRFSASWQIRRACRSGRPSSALRYGRWPPC